MSEIIKVKVPLVGEDGNAFSIIGRVSRALRRAGNPPEVVDEYKRRCTSGDYDNLLRVTMEYTGEFEVEEGE